MTVVVVTFSGAGGANVDGVRHGRGGLLPYNGVRCKGDRKGRPYAGVRLSESAERILRRAEGSPPYGGAE